MTGTANCQQLTAAFLTKDHILLFISNKSQISDLDITLDVPNPIKNVIM